MVSCKTLSGYNSRGAEMPNEKLTKRVVDALRSPEPSQAGQRAREKLAWDRDLRGFGVQIMPSGLKSFVIQYRNNEGRTRRTVIGRYGLMTVEQARQIAHEKLVAVSKGVDPAEQARQAGAITVREICEWYLKEASSGHLLGRQRRPIKASTLAMDLSRIQTHIIPLIGTRQVRSLRVGDIEGMQADIARGRTAKSRSGGRGGTATGGGGVAARTISTLHAMLEHAVRLGLLEANPARGVRKLASNPRQRRLSTSEIAVLGQTMREAGAAGEHPTGLAAIRFLLLTGFRRTECLSLQRNWVAYEDRYVRFPDTKSGPQIRVIGEPALGLLKCQVGPKGSPFVFPADWGEGHFIGVVRVLGRVCARADMEGVTPHVLRHTFASVAGDLGFSELTIAALLGHAARGVTQRYIHIDDALRMAANRIAEEISMLLDGQRSRERSRNGRIGEIRSAGAI